MTDAEREAHWDAIYDERDFDEVGWYQSTPTISLDLIDQLDLDREARIIDVGGGRSKLVDALLEHDFTDITVLDLSASALEQSQKRLGERAEPIDWRQGDLLEWDGDEDSFDLWHDRAVFHFLTDPGDRTAYLETLDEALADEGHVILATFTIDAPAQCSGLPVARRDPEHFDEVLGDAFELLETRQEVHLTPSGVRQPYVYGLFERARK